MELLHGKLLGFVLILSRLGAFFFTAPIFSWQVMTPQLKVAVVVVLSLFFSALVPCSYNTEDPGLIQITILIAEEIIYGLCLGLTAYFLFAVVQQAGHIIERQMGLTMANILDPFSGEQGAPIGMLLEILFILLIFCTDSYHILINIMARSFDKYPLGSPPGIASLTESILVSSSYLLLLALQMSAPILAAFLLLMVVLAFMARVAPETNVLFLSLPLRVGMGLLITGFFIPFLSDYVQQFTKWVIRLLPT